jgi:hypothetical protein
MEKHREKIRREIFISEKGKQCLRILYDNELHNLHVSPDSVVKSKRMKIVRNVACVGKLEVH